MSVGEIGIGEKYGGLVKKKRGEIDKMCKDVFYALARSVFSHMRRSHMTSLFFCSRVVQVFVDAKFFLVEA